MAWIIIMVLFVFWLMGYRFQVGGKAIHTLLIIALIVVLVRLLS